MHALHKTASGSGKRSVFDLNPMIAARYALDEWEEAFANLCARRDVKALIYPNGRDW